MKNYIEESKRIKIELNKINDRSNQICRILDKDDIDVNFINKIGKKKEHEDILEYMKNLDSWDKKHIYKPQTPIVSQQTNINNENENEINPENQESNQENKK